MGNRLITTLIQSPCLNSIRCRPSKLAHAVFLESLGTHIRKSMESGSNIGRKDNV